MSFNFGNTGPVQFRAGAVQPPKLPAVVAAEKAEATARAVAKAFRQELDFVSAKATEDAATAERKLKSAHADLQDLRENLHHWGMVYAKAHQTKDMDETAYDQIVSLQELEEKNRKTIRDLRAEKDRLTSATNTKDAQIQERDEKISARDSKVASLEKLLKDAKKDLATQEAANQNVDGLLQKSYADSNNLKEIIRSLHEAKDRAQTKASASQLKIDSLYEQYLEAHTKVEELESANAELQELQHQLEELNVDMENAQSQAADNENVLKVKDARITHLEEQLQKALTEVRHVSDAAARAAGPTAAPIITQGESLQSELDELDDNSFVEDGASELVLYDLVGVVPWATIDCPPVMPSLSLATIPPISIIDVSPIEPVHEELTFTSTASAVDIAPVEPVSPELAISAVSSTDSAPVELTAPALAISVVSTIDAAPVEPSITLTAVPNASTLETAPIEPTPAELTFSTIAATDAAPVDPIRPAITISTVSAMEALPIEPAVPTLTTSTVSVIDVGPVEPVVNLTVVPTASTLETVPVEHTPAALSISTILAIDAATIEPVVDLTVVSTASTIETVPTQHTPAALTTSSISATDTAPIEPSRQEISTQTDAPALALSGIVDNLSVSPVEVDDSALSFSNVVDTLNVSPVDALQFEAPTASFSHIIDTIDVSPVEISQVDAPTQTNTLTLAVSGVVNTLSTSPIDVPQSDAPTQTDVPVAVLSGVVNTLNISPIEVPLVETVPQTDTATFGFSNVTELAVAPIDPEALPTTEPTVAPAYTSSSVQATETAIETKLIAPSTSVPSFSKLGYFMLSLLMLLVAVSWMRVIAIERENGRYVNNYGAFGNPRHFLGIFPFGYDIGSFGWTESLARHLSTFIDHFEAWAGVDKTIYV